MAEGDVNGVKEEPKTEVKTENVDSANLDPQIVRQIEYYFGDINLPRDKFLQEQIKLDDGWVPLEVMLKFKRLSSLTTDCDVISNALAASQLMEVSEDKKKIRRDPSQPLPVFNEERRKELMTRTIYAKGFPLESTLDELLAFFGQYGPIDNVQMRNYKNKETNKFVFKGSVFVIFKTKDLAAEFLEKDVKYEDNELLTKWQSVYLEEKRKERADKKRGSKTNSPNDNDKMETDVIKKRNKKEPFALGAILHLKGFNSETTRDELRDKLIKDGLDVAFIDFNKGQEEAWIRLLGENSAKNYVEKLENKKVVVVDTELEARALEGEEESKFLEKTREEMDKRRGFNYKNRHNKGRKGGRGGRGRSGYLGKRKGGQNDEAPVKKEVKTEEPDSD